MSKIGNDSLEERCPHCGSIETVQTELYPEKTGGYEIFKYQCMKCSAYFETLFIHNRYIGQRIYVNGKYRVVQ